MRRLILDENFVGIVIRNHGIRFRISVYVNSLDYERTVPGAVSRALIVSISSHPLRNYFIVVKVLISVDRSSVGIFNNGTHRGIQAQPTAIDDNARINVFFLDAVNGIRGILLYKIYARRTEA